MNTSMLSAALLALAAAIPLQPAAAHDGHLDITFGDGGMRNYGFQSYFGSGRNDKAAAVACPGPNGTLVVTGEASDATRLVTMRLLPNGDYDPAYGAGGRVSVEFAMTPEPYMAGVCLPDSKILLARRVRIGSLGEMSIQLLRIDATNGRLDPAFGQNGATVLDLDTWQTGLGQVEAPMMLTLLDGGEVLLTGHVAMPGGFAAFAARIADDGYVPVARVYAQAPSQIRAHTFMSALQASDGNLWGVIEGVHPGSDRITPFRVRFDRVTLQWLDVPDPRPNAQGEPIYAGRGVRVHDDVLAVPMIQHVNGSSPRRSLPGVMIYRAGGKVFLPLPPPQLPGEPTLTISEAFALQSAVTVSEGRVLLALAVERAGDNVARGMYLAMVRVGSGTGSDALDTSFGNGGTQLVAFRPVGPACPATLVAQDFSGLTLWNAAVTLVGNVDASCSNAGGAVDYLVARLQADRVLTGPRN